MCARMRNPTKSHSVLPWDIRGTLGHFGLQKVIKWGGMHKGLLDGVQKHPTCLVSITIYLFVTIIVPSWVFFFES